MLSSRPIRNHSKARRIPKMPCIIASTAIKIRLPVRFIEAPRTCPDNDTGSGELLRERLTATGCQEAWDAAPLLRGMTHKAGHNILSTGAA